MAVSFVSLIYKEIVNKLFSPTLLVCLGYSIEGKKLPPLLCVLFNFLVLSVSLWFVFKSYKILFSPLDLYRDGMSVGYVHHDLRVGKEQNIKNALNRKKIGDTPPVYPNGWFRIMDSRSLERGKVKSVYVFGQQLAVFRNKRGIVRVTDAYCPHLGANLAAGGKVVDSDCLECPFHGWKFRGEDGKLMDIPYAAKIPNFVSLGTWPCCEINGVIFIWYHCDKTEPEWRIPKADSIDDLKYVGRTEHIINAHIQDIPENAADIAHLDHLHRPVIGNNVEQTNNSFLNNILRHGIQASWKPNENERHVGSMSIQDDVHLDLFGYKFHLLSFKFNILQIGPGAVLINLENRFFRGLMVQNVTPVEPYQQQLSHSFYISSWIPLCIAKPFYLLEATQIERDILMWNNKTYLRNPVLVKEESVLAKHRRWYQQFYSERSPKYENLRDNSSITKSSLEW